MEPKHCAICNEDLYSIADKKSIEMYGACLMHLTDEQFYCVCREIELMENCG